MWGICSPISLPIRSPDKAFRTGQRKRKWVGLQQAYFLQSMGPCGQEWYVPRGRWHFCHPVLPTDFHLGWLPVRVPLSSPKESQWNKALPMGAAVYTVKAECVCLTLPLRPSLQRLSLVRISASSPCSSLSISLARSEEGRSGYIQMRS